MATETHDLYPTPTRLKLLQGVKAKQVTWYPNLGAPAPDAYWDDRDGERMVTARFKELERAGWVEVGEADFEGENASRRTVLTPAGEALLTEHEQQTEGAAR